MDTEDNGNVGFKQKGVVLNCPSSGIDSNSNSISSEKINVMAMCSSESMFKSPTGEEETFYGCSNWDPLVVPLNHGQILNEFGNNNNSHYLLENKPIVSSSSHLVNQHHHHYTPDSAMINNMVPKIPCFGSGNFSDMTSSFGLPGCNQVPADTNYHQIYNSMKPIGSQEDGLISNDGAFGGNNKKRKASESSSPPLNNKKKNVERSENSSDHSKGKEETKRNTSVKQTKDNINSMSEEPSKETYIHMRAKRGQATNSHSLAERVRRERISERMRLLQELVPGCNKITGKAVMLDEIINYVQSLQQQVEFLSMKLATVNPELNFDLDRMLSKDILHPSRVINAANLNMGQGLISSHMFPNIGFPQGTFPGIPDASPSFHPLPQSVWDNELHNLLQMGFDSDASTTNAAQNEGAKLELWSSREK